MKGHRLSPFRGIASTKWACSSVRLVTGRGVYSRLAGAHGPGLARATSFSFSGCTPGSAGAVEPTIVLSRVCVSRWIRR